MTTKTTDLQTVVDDFNAEHGSVTWVRYWTGTRDDAPKYNLTDGKAWLLGGHTPVVRVRGEGSCIALTHIDVLPGQPDDIDDDSHDLPSPVRAAERVREYISANGDGIYDVIDGHPLYARDLEALRRAGEQVAELAAERDAARDMANTARQEARQALHALDKARAVIEAAKTWRDWYAASPVRMQHLSDAEEALFAAVDALPTVNTDDKPCCGYRCQDNTTGVTA